MNTRKYIIKSPCKNIRILQCKIATKKLIKGLLHYFIMNDQLSLKERILEEMSVSYANALEKNFEEAKKWIRVTSSGTIDILKKDGLGGTEEVVLYLIGKKYAKEAGLAENDSATNQELCEELGKTIGSIGPWLKTLRDSGYAETTSDGSSIKINQIASVLRELAKKGVDESNTSVIKTNSESVSSGKKKKFVKPSGKLPEAIQFDVSESNEKPSLVNFFNNHSNPNTHYDVISCIAYYFEKHLKGKELEEGHARYAYQYLRKRLPVHFHQAFVDSKNKSMYLENGSEPTSWKISYDGELHVEQDLETNDKENTENNRIDKSCPLQTGMRDR